MSVRIKIFLVILFAVVILTSFSLGMCSLFSKRTAPGRWGGASGAAVIRQAGILHAHHHTMSVLATIAIGTLAAFAASGKLAEPYLKTDKSCPSDGLADDGMLQTQAIMSEKRERRLANMRRDMRKPLNSVIRLSEYVLCGDKVYGEARDSIEKIHNAGMTLLSIVNGIANIPAAEARKFDLTPVEYDVPSLINDIVTLHAVRMIGKPVKFSLRISEDLPRKLFGDELRIELICNNLLDNAFKYTKSGSVDLSFECEKDKDDGRSEWLTIRVADTGAGIRQEDFGKVFSDRTGTVFSKPGDKVDDTWLSVTKSIVEMMGGTIAFSSEYGKGSVFTARVRQGDVADARIGKAVAESLMSFHYGVNAIGVEKPARVQLPGVRVMVIDDVQVNLDIARAMLEPYGMKVDCLTSGWQAIRSICERQVNYDAIFTDLYMPKIDGVKTATVIHEEIGTEYARGIPIFALTASMITDGEKESFGDIFQDVISKPIDPARLDALIVRWLAGKEGKRGRARNHAERDQAPAVLKPPVPLPNRIPLESMLESA